MVGGQEVACEVQAVNYLKQHGHREAVPLCKHKLRAPDGTLRAEVDAGAVAKGCAVLVEKKPRLTLHHVNSAKKTFDGVKYVLVAFILLFALCLLCQSWRIMSSSHPTSCRSA